jgi:hypothetical protein
VLLAVGEDTGLKNGIGPNARRNGWEGQQLAFLEADYDQHMAQIEEIEMARYLPPLSYLPLLQAPASPASAPG